MIAVAVKWPEPEFTCQLNGSATVQRESTRVRETSEGVRGAEFCGLVAGVKCDAVLKQRRSHQQPSSTGEKKCAALPRGSHNAKKKQKEKKERERKSFRRHSSSFELLLLLLTMCNVLDRIFTQCWIINYYKIAYLFISNIYLKWWYTRKLVIYTKYIKC